MKKWLSLLIFVSLGFIPYSQLRAREQTRNFQPAETVLEQGFTLVPEFKPVRGFLLSEIILDDENGYRLLAFLLQQGSEIWLLSTSTEPVAQKLIQHLRSHYHLSAQALAHLKVIPIETETPWARDWAPLTAFSVDLQGQMIRHLLDFRYSYGDRNQDDVVPEKMWERMLLQENSQARLELIQYSVHLEGGNVMCNTQICFISRAALEGNSKQLVGVQAAYSESELIQELQATLKQDLFLIDAMPFEETGHLDMWAKFIQENLLLVAEIDREALQILPPILQQRYKVLADFLDQQATGYTPVGDFDAHSLFALLKQAAPELEIVRIPMPLPLHQQENEIFRTYTNSLLVDKVAVVPKYERIGGVGYYYPDRKWMTSYEAEVEAAYHRAGYRVEWLAADYLIQDGGAWHCTAMQIPAWQAQATDSVAQN